MDSEKISTTKKDINKKDFENSKKRACKDIKKSESVVFSILNRNITDSDETIQRAKGGILGKSEASDVILHLFQVVESLEKVLEVNGVAKSKKEARAFLTSILRKYKTAENCIEDLLRRLEDG